MQSNSSTPSGATIGPVENKIVSLSAARLPAEEDLRDFEPTDAHVAIAGALNEPTETTNLSELAEVAGVSSRTLRRAISDPAALSWIVAQSSRLAESRLGAVHARLYQMAMTSRSSAWCKLYLERFDGDYKKQKVLEKGGAHVHNHAAEMDHNELVAHIVRKLRLLQGSTGTPPIIDAQIRGLPGPDGTGGDLLPHGSDPDGSPHVSGGSVHQPDDGAHL